MKKHLKKFLCLAMISLPILDNFSHAQVTGGQNAFSYLQLANGTHSTSLGGIVPTMVDKQIDFVRQNPALLQQYHHNDLMVTYSQWASDIRNSNLQYAYHIPKVKTNFSVGLQYLDYGTMHETNIYGERLGRIKAQDYTLYISASRLYKNNWSYGANLKFAISNLGHHTAAAGLIDFGINYHTNDTLWQFGLVAKNIGVTLKKYDRTQGAEPLPFDLQFGVAKRLKNIPLTFMFSGHHLYAWDIRYNDPADKSQNIFEDPNQKESKYFADKLFRHINVGAQLYLAKRIYINFAYGHLTRSELAYEHRMGLSGFSFGVQARLHKFNLGYTFSTASIASPIHEVGLQLKLSDYISVSEKNDKWQWKQ